MITKRIYKKLGKILLKRNLQLAVAESCTGGFISKSITDIPGSSKYFWGGIVCYSNESKVKFLNVKEKTLKKYGAVSFETAKEMVCGILKISKASLGVAVTGIAGPSGGTEEKPVGTIFTAVKYKNKIHMYKFLFKGNRNIIRKKIVNTIGKILIKTIC
jgi:PncC family amidohydrolase